MKLSLPRISKFFYADFDATIDGYYTLELPDLKSSNYSLSIMPQSLKHKKHKSVIKNLGDHAKLRRKKHKIAKWQLVSIMDQRNISY
jgi:hypothetical protein